MAEEEVKSESKYPLSECVPSVWYVCYVTRARGGRARVSSVTLEHTKQLQRTRHCDGAVAAARRRRSKLPNMHVLTCELHRASRGDLLGPTGSEYIILYNSTHRSNNEKHYEYAEVRL